MRLLRNQICKYRGFCLMTKIFNCDCGENADKTQQARIGKNV
jgi:hypothetical protein